jgi:hypothetical protein
VMPQDRDQLHLGQKAVVRVHSANQRTTHELNGAVRRDRCRRVEGYRCIGSVLHGVGHRPEG